jgi:hypothetical protein
VSVLDVQISDGSVFYKWLVTMEMWPLLVLGLFVLGAFTFNFVKCPPPHRARERPIDEFLRTCVTIGSDITRLVGTDSGDPEYYEAAQRRLQTVLTHIERASTSYPECSRLIPHFQSLIDDVSEKRR